MKRITDILLYIVFFLSVAMGNEVFAQRTLMVDKTGTTRHYFFRKGDKCKLRMISPDTLLSGEIWHVDDSAVWITGWRPTEVRINNIAAVYKRFHFPTMLSGYTAVGALAFFSLISVNHLINNEQVFTSDSFIVPGILLGISGVSFLLSEKKCRIGKRWKVKILEMP